MRDDGEDLLRTDQSMGQNGAVDLHGHGINVGSMTTLFPMMMHAHLVTHRVMMVVVGVSRRDGCKHRDASHGSKKDLFHICDGPVRE